ncbi:MAG: DUF3710 domain-containing protein [Actinobacteria bacterium]|uniref:Unannotated protein n=1 Tax=freshwater metagenome TaxID=449393 RepID=A0A6J7HAZ0_9ZZZZ|nr:DUF3710 domain-containing protein [Actinomycetota bacterium]
MTDDVRANGPWDDSEIDFADGVERIDLGALLVPATEGMDLQVQVDENSGNVVQVTLAMKDCAVQVQPYAAPRSGGMWSDVRAQIKKSISTSGGLVEDADGPFGVELRAQVQPSDGGKTLQSARFVGAEGPRWFLRAVFLGKAARPGPEAAALEAVVRGLVVVRGGEAMAVGSPIVMRLPDSMELGGSAGRPPVNPFERGPEITEIR